MTPEDVQKVEEFKSTYAAELPEIYDVLECYLGKSIFGEPNLTHNGKHPFVQVYCIPPFDIKAHEPELSKLLDAKNWTFVFRDKQKRDGNVLGFGASPIISKTVRTALVCHPRLHYQESH